EAVLVGYRVKLGTTTRRQRKGRNAGGGSGAGPAPAEPVSPPASAGNGSSAGAEVSERPMAKPPVRKLAKDLGVDLAELTGSGPEGTITREDVQAAAGGRPVGSAPPPEPAPASAAGAAETGPRHGGRRE